MLMISYLSFSVFLFIKALGLDCSALSWYQVTVKIGETLAIWSVSEINARACLRPRLTLRCSSRLGTDFTADEEGCEVLPTSPRSATGEKAISYRWQRNPLELESNYWIWPKNELSKCEDLIYKSYLEENQCWLLAKEGSLQEDTIIIHEVKFPSFW